MQSGLYSAQDHDGLALIVVQMHADISAAFLDLLTQLNVHLRRVKIT
jgi:hypothetical protein